MTAVPVSRMPVLLHPDPRGWSFTMMKNVRGHKADIDFSSKVDGCAAPVIWQRAVRLRAFLKRTVGCGEPKSSTAA